jgi:hypothetical protein
MAVNVKMNVKNFFLIMFLLSPVSVFTQEISQDINSDKEQNSEENKSPEKKVPSPYPFIFIEANGGRGFNIPHGRFAGEKIEKVKQNVYAGGLSVGAEFLPFLGISFETEYMRETIRVDRTFAGYPAVVKRNVEFVNYMIGYFGTWKYFYAEAGYYYGKASFDWKKTTKCNGLQTEEPIESPEKKDIKGIYYGAGFVYNLEDAFYLTLGVHCEHPLSPAINGQDKISPDAYIIRGGFQYRITL